MAFKTIAVKGNGIRKEDVAIAAITPGELVETAPTGVQRHSTAAGNAAPSFALENELEGDGIDVDYAVGAQVMIEHMPRGAEVYALLGASTAAVVKGSYLESNGDGSLRLTTAAAATANTARAGIIARALEPVTPSASKTRCLVEIL